MKKQKNKTDIEILVDAEILNKIQYIAEQKGMDFNDYIISVINDYISMFEKKHSAVELNSDKSN